VGPIFAVDVVLFAEPVDLTAGTSLA